MENKKVFYIFNIKNKSISTISTKVEIINIKLLLYIYIIIILFI